MRALGFACFREAGSYAGGSVATGRASLAGQVPTEKPDEVCPSTTYLIIPYPNILSRCRVAAGSTSVWVGGRRTSRRPMAALKVQLDDYCKRVESTLFQAVEKAIS